MEYRGAKIKKKLLRGAKKYGKFVGIKDMDSWTVKKTVNWICVKSFWSVIFFFDASERSSSQKTAVSV